MPATGGGKSPAVTHRVNCTSSNLEMHVHRCNNGMTITGGNQPPQERKLMPGTVSVAKNLYLGNLTVPGGESTTMILINDHSVKLPSKPAFLDP